MLLLTTVLALGAAWAGPTMRGWEPERWKVFGGTLVVSLLSAAAGYAGQGFFMGRERRKAGGGLVWLVRAESDPEIKSRSTMLTSSPGPVSGVFAVLSLLVVAFFEASTLYLPSSGGDSGYFRFNIWSLMIGVGCWFAINHCSIRGVALGQNGVFVASESRCYPWKVVTVIARPEEDEDDELTLRFRLTYPKRIVLSVPAEVRRAVDERLAECLPAQHD